MTRRASTAVLLITLASIPIWAHGQEVEETCKAKESESPNAALHRCADAKRMMSNAMKTIMDEASNEVHAQASSADAADASGSRVSDSLADLLPLFQGAVTPANTAGDGTPVVLNFNSPPFLRGKTSLQATLTEPKLFSPLEEAFVKADRDAETKGLLDEAGGFGDTTYSLGWSPVRRAGNWETKRQLFGREPETYRPLVKQYADAVLLPEYTNKVVKLLDAADESLIAPAKDLSVLFGGVHPDVILNDMTFFQLREKAKTTPNVDLTKANALIDQMAKAAEELAVFESDAQATLDERDKLDERFAALIGNQPELQVRATYRDADRAVGPRDYALSVVYAAGSRNFNRLLEDYRALVEQAEYSIDEIKKLPEKRRELQKQAFENLTTEAIDSDWWRMTYAITYKKIDDYAETFEGVVDDDGVVQKPAVPLAVPGVEEWQLRLTYSQLAGPDLFAAEARPRIAFSVEGTWVQEDGAIPEAMRRQDRLVGRITYTVPTTDNMTFPVSIVFANHPEFLSEDKDLQNQLSAHVGLSYKLPRPNSVVKPVD